MLAILSGILTLVKPKMVIDNDSDIIDIIDYPETEITDIIIYPMRGAGGIHLESAKLEKAGLVLDREWFLLDID